MADTERFSPWSDQSGLIRLGGAAMLIGLAIHIVANGLFRVFPPEGLSPDDLRSYLTAQAGDWAILHGVRYVAIVSIVLFGAGLFVKCSLTRPTHSLGWGIVGLIGTLMWVINLFIVNGIETMAFMKFDHLTENASSFWALYYLTRTLFNAEVVAWSVVWLGFSMAGLHSKTLPKWLVWTGLFSAANGLMVGIFIVPVMNGEWPGIFVDLAALPGMIWFLSVATLMVWRGK